MKNYLYLFIACSLLVSCHQDLEYECCACESVYPCDIFALSNYPGAWPAKPGLWDYPVKPGMEEWGQLNSLEKKVNACQIPEELLSSLSTEDLTNICVRYPLLGNVFAWNTFHYGLNALYDQFNGIRELFKRKDAWKELLKYSNCLITLANSSQFDLVEESYSRFLYSIFNDEVLFLLGFYVQKADAISKKDCKKILQCLCRALEPGIHHASMFNYYARANAINRIDPKIFENMPYMYDGMASWISYPNEDKEFINKLSYKLMK